MPLLTDEIQLLSNPKFFELKTDATEKLKSLMEQVREVYLLEIHPEKLLAPPETDFAKGQIAKGENYEGYPYVMLDFPKRFGKGEIFTYRTMFWYGHFFIFSFIVSGKQLPVYQANLITHYAELCDHNLLFCKDDIWDWRLSSTIPLTIQTKQQVMNSLHAQNFIKVVLHLPPVILSDEAAILQTAKSFAELTEKIARKS
jgi:hypothetical protein